MSDDLEQRAREFRRNQCEGDPMSDEEVVSLIRAELEAVKQEARELREHVAWEHGGREIDELTAKLGERQR